MLITSLLPEIVEDCRIPVVVKITTAFILRLGKCLIYSNGREKSLKEGWQALVPPGESPGHTVSKHHL